MSKAEIVKKIPAKRSEKTPKSQEERSRDKLIRESRDQYRDFLDSINRSSDRDIDRAMSRM